MLTREGKGKVSEKLNEKTVRRLKTDHKEGTNVIYWDEELSGFGLRINQNGVVSFVLTYYIHKIQKRMTIGRHPEWSVIAARNEAAELRKQIREGRDPLDEREQIRNEPTLGEWIDRYLTSAELKKKRPNTQREVQRMARTILKPALGERQLKAITRHDIERLHMSLEETRYQANRLLSLLSKLFNDAIRDEVVAKNPVLGVTRFEEEKCERYLSPDEFERFQTALDKYLAQHQGTRYESGARNAVNALRLLLLTGSRADEVTGATWAEFDLARRSWTKPARRTKQAKASTIPLSPEAVELLMSMKPRRAEGPLFARVSLRRPFYAVCEMAGLGKQETVKTKGGREAKKFMPDLRIHDLRHSYASTLVSNGISLPVIGKLLGHANASTTQRYAHLQDEALRAATDSFAKIIKMPKRTA
jgi:integrase